MKLKITKEQSGARIDKFLADNLSDFSRNQIQKLFKQDNITVNEKIISKHYKLKEDDLILIEKEEDKVVEESVGEGVEEGVEEGFVACDLEEIANTEEYLVINKPAGIAMHGAEHMKEITLADLIIERYPEVRKIGEDPIRPGIVHRIDKEVSGLVVIAKTQDSFDSLKKQFQERTVKKEYTALVYGKIEKYEDEIRFPIDRASTGHKMAALPEVVKGKPNSKGRKAITQFEVMENFINYSLVKVKIKTGRTHQIRVHMTAYGHPIVGDSLYNTKRTREQNKKINLGRVFLFASKLSFNDLSGEEVAFESEMPEELKARLKKVK